jgi:tRNA (Thr-GGU) A37 N-methylase
MRDAPSLSPESIGLSIARLIARRSNVIAIEGVDVLDGTPLLDIKPYVPDFDARENIRVGWFDFLARFTHEPKHFYN